MSNQNIEQTRMNAELSLKTFGGTDRNKGGTVGNVENRGHSLADLICFTLIIGPIMIAFWTHDGDFASLFLGLLSLAGGIIAIGIEILIAIDRRNVETINKAWNSP